MDNSELFIGLVLLIIVVLFTTANMAIRHFSRARLSERLERRGKAELLGRLLDCQNDLLFVTALVRMGAILALVLLIAHFLGVSSSSESEVTSKYVVIFLVSIVLIAVFGVAVPNAWARYNGDTFLAFALPTLLGIRFILYPLLAFYHLVDGLVRRLAGVPNNNEEETEADQIEKEILDVVSEGEAAGAVHEEDADMIESVMEFRDTDVGEIMTPRTEVSALPATVTLAEAKDFIEQEGHSRIPIYGENIDEIKGVLYAKDLLSLDEAGFDPLRIMRKVPFVPETKRVPDLLQELREKKVHLAVVLDEYGGTAGLVTIEDILEEIVGEIADEYEAPEPEPMRQIDSNTIEVDARVHIDEINDALKIELPEDEDYDTVGGFVFSTMGKIPVVGEELSYSNIKFRVLDAEERKINRLRVEVAREEADD
ncbi:MAG: HlyC/CorC family transporter [Planctomycetota bacterium]|nr:MAG: HlyC/CorC family transporter [Planctomycetota bacterium]